MSEELLERLMRIEESQAFTDRTVEGISDQVLSLYKKLDQLEAQVARLRRELNESASAADQQARDADAEDPGDDPAS
jgi:uncharacterized coiled-coil protein SlyX